MDLARALAFDVLVAALKLWISASPSDEPHWREIRAELGVLENRRSSLTLETSAPIDPKSEWFPVLVNAIHVHMLLLNSVYCDIVQPIDIDPHVRAKMLGLLFPGGESLDRSSDTYLPEHEAEAGSEGRARGVRTRYDRILGDDDAHAESHVPSHDKVRMPFEGSAQSAASATDASPGSLSNEGAVAGTAGGSPDASSQGEHSSPGSEEVTMEDTLDVDILDRVLKGEPDAGELRPLLIRILGGDAEAIAPEQTHRDADSGLQLPPDLSRSGRLARLALRYHEEHRRSPLKTQS